jgi:hypothetical protein
MEMRTSIVNLIRDMGQDDTVTIRQIDDFVDECIHFLEQQQATTKNANYSNDIFELESARQNALVSKFSLTVQPW